MIERSSPAIAASLHTAAEIRPFTTAFAPPQSLNHGPTTIEPYQVCALRITLLSTELEALASAWSVDQIGEIMLEGMHWRVERVARSSDEHPWAGQSSYDQLITEAMGRAATADGRWDLEFATPVTFRQRGKNQPLPTADLVFGSLLDRWNTSAPMPLPPSLREAVEAQVAVSNVDLRSVVLPTKGGALQIGVVGSCGYTLVGRDRTWVASLDLLSRFAFYSGIGAGTTRGFGMSRLRERLHGRPAKKVQTAEHA